MFYQMYALALLKPIMVIVITIAGIVMLFGAVGMRISNNLGATVVGGIFKGIGYICRTLLQAFGWIVRNAFRMIPRIYNESKRIFSQMGLNTTVSALLAVLVVIAFIALLI